MSCEAGFQDPSRERYFGLAAASRRTPDLRPAPAATVQILSRLVLGFIGRRQERRRTAGARPFAAPSTLILRFIGPAGGLPLGSWDGSEETNAFRTEAGVHVFVPWIVGTFFTFNCSAISFSDIRLPSIALILTRHR